MSEQIFAKRFCLVYYMAENNEVHHHETSRYFTVWSGCTYQLSRNRAPGGQTTKNIRVAMAITSLHTADPGTIEGIHTHGSRAAGLLQRVDCCLKYPLNMLPACWSLCWNVHCVFQHKWKDGIFIRQRDHLHERYKAHRPTCRLAVCLHQMEWSLCYFRRNCMLSTINCDCLVTNHIWEMP